MSYPFLPDHSCCFPSYYLMLYFLHTTCSPFHSAFYHTDQPTQSPTGIPLIKVCHHSNNVLSILLSLWSIWMIHVALYCLFSFSSHALFYPKNPYHNSSPNLLFLVVIDHNDKLCDHLESMWCDVGSSRKSVRCGYDIT